MEGCNPYTAFFTDSTISWEPTYYIWDFGDGSPIDTNKNPVHTFTKPGVYKVKLSSIDSFSCNIAAFDSTYITVKEMPTADFEFSTEECSNEFTFKNKSKWGECILDLLAKSSLLILESIGKPLSSISTNCLLYTSDAADE